ncbi:CoA transferase [Microbacterium indicum]|uniref:CoA transferase n=1 Tax=Microbacterium indicum TaxID=358100 RepID=UPI0003FA8DCB|nr:CoA transferase [Microbacterium indicum]
MDRVTWTGPRRWWGGPLDVEGLALAAAGEVARELAELTGREVAYDSAAVAGWYGSVSHLRVDGRPIAGFAPLSGFFRAADGWVRTHANYPHHERALLSALGVEDGPSALAAMERIPAREIERSVFDAGGLAVAVRGAGELASARVTGILDAAPTARFLPHLGAHPLAGLRVLDLTRVIAGPSAARLLAALGADVLRADPPHLPELEGQHIETGFGKRHVVAGPDAIEPLLTGAHVVLVGYRFRGGLAPEALRERHPHLAIAALDAWGDAPGWAGRRGFDSVVQAGVGIARAYGSEDRPGALPVQALDMTAGLRMASAVLALVRRGEAGRARVSLIDAAADLMDLEPPADPVHPVAPRLGEMPSAFGRLVYAPPPFSLDGAPLHYPSPPPPVGSGSAAWA